MKRLQFSIEINAPVQHVYESMLGLKSKSTYEYWTYAFNPTSTLEGNWDKGSKILFVGVDENGKRGGMVSEIAEHIPAKMVAIRHYGFIDGENEITSGEMVEKWAGGMEIYHYSENNGVTKVIAEVDALEDFESYFNEHYPQALKRLKEWCEK